MKQMKNPDLRRSPISEAAYDRILREAAADRDRARARLLLALIRLPAVAARAVGRFWTRRIAKLGISPSPLARPASKLIRDFDPP